MTTLAEPVIPDSIADHCSSLLALALHLSQAEDPGELEPFRLKLTEAVGEFTSRATQAGLPEGDIELCKYAVVGLLDEIVFDSSWGLKEAWLGNPLQMHFFNSFTAGEEFFTKLESLRTPSTPAKREVLEVYYQCLCLGFKGMHAGLEGMEKLKDLTTGLSAQIAEASGSKASSDLSPRWSPPDKGSSEEKDLPVRVVIVACLLALVILYFILATVLGSGTDSVLETLG